MNAYPINETISNTQDMSKTKLKVVNAVVITPSIDFRDLVTDYIYEVPPVLRQLLNVIGSKNKSDLESYLLFEPGYLSALIDQGYKDAQLKKDEILDVINKKALE